MSLPPSNSKTENSDDMIKILVATDLHLGYEYNRKRGQQSDDSFITFEEILQYGKEHEVDFILLGGDLFHDTKPSQTAILNCMNLLRKYCLGPREVKIEFLSDPEVVFRHCAYKTVNYEDPNLNVSMPIFSIHGNHDDPSFGAIGSMDLLSVSGLVNYFGKWTDLTQITIPPLIIRKGKTCVALYGLSYINDQRLSRLLRDYKVDMLRPKEIPDCFNIFVLHQNRVKHGEYGYVPQNKLPRFLNLIIWGHEHECRITPEFVPETEYFISQPGSSIATSLCEGEAKRKYVGILTIHQQKFKMEKLKLKTVRPFIFEDLILQEHEIPKNYTQSLSESVYDFVDDYIENVVIPKAASLLSGHPKQPIQPLLRLRIFYSNDDEVFDGIKLGQKYCEEVANPLDIVIFRKQQKNANKDSKSALIEMNDELQDMAQVLAYDNEEENWNSTVQGGIKKYFMSEENKNKLTVLTVQGLNEALNRFVNRGDIDAFKDIVTHQMKKTIRHLETCNVTTTESICNEIKSFRDNRMLNDKEEQEIQNLFDNTRNKSQNDFDDVPNIDFDSDDGEYEKAYMVPKTTKSVRGRGGAKGRGSRGRGRGSVKANEKDSHDIATTSASPKIQHAKRQLKRKVENTLENFISVSSKENKTDVLVIDDSDSDF